METMEETTRERGQKEDISTDTPKTSLATELSVSKEEVTMPNKVAPEDDQITNNLPDNSNEEDTRSVGSESDISDRSRTESGEEVDNEVEEDDDASVVLEREEGDGQESTPNRKVDDDEDKRNPQYIPKRGTFYEHDDRTAVEEEEEAEKTEETERTEKDASKKKVWSEKESSRWSHDRFNDQDQAPKSRTELVSIYGYDIRNEEGPPRARRRRRYGRGPNKYTRNWEDEDAYNKMQAPSPRGTGRKSRPKGEDFPPLDGRRTHSRSSDVSDDKAASGDSEQIKEVNNISHDNGNRVDMGKGDIKPVPVQRIEQPIRNENGNYKSPKQPPPKREIREPRETRELREPRETRELREPREIREPREMREPRELRESRDLPERRDPRTISRIIKPTMKTEDSNRGISHTRGVTRTRGFRGAGRGDNRNRNQKIIPQDDNSDYIMSQNFTNKSINQQVLQDVEKEMSNMNLQESGYSRGGKFNGSRQTSVPPRLQAEQRGSKRYSSLRQRSLPETAAQPSFNQQHPVIHYPPEYVQQNPQQPNQQGILPHPQPTIVSQVPTNTTQPIMTVVQPNGQSMGPIPHQGPPNGAPLLQGPPITAQYASPYPPGPPAFIQAGVAPPPFIPPQGMNGPPQIINFQPPQFPPPDFANFPHQPQFAPVNQPPPADVYHQASQGGITYYSMQSQQVIPRVQAKRPKAAIPIVPPPEHKEPRGRGRLSHGEDSPVGGTPDLQKENFELENNGMQYGGDIVVQQ